MDLLDAFKIEQWDAQEGVVAGERALLYEIVTPRETKKCIVWHGGDGRLFHMAASNSYEEDIAKITVHCLKAAALPCSRLAPVTVVPADFQGVARFNRIVVAPPEVELFDHFSEELRKTIYLVAPAYASEFSDCMSARDFRHQIGRKDGWRVYVYRWNRVEKTSPSWD